MNGDRHDVLPPGERIPDHNYTAEGVDSYYHQGSFQPQNSQETAQYYAGGQMGDDRYSSQSSFSAPSEQAHSAAGPQQAAPARRKPSQRQRSGNLSMLRVQMLYHLLNLFTYAFTHLYTIFKGQEPASLNKHCSIKTASPQVPPKIAEKYVNLLVVGESGLGKTTFIRNCFSDLLHDDFELSDASWGSMTEFKDSPSVFCTHLPAIEVPEALIRLRYSVQDVPGYVLPAYCFNILWLWLAFYRSIAFNQKHSLPQSMFHVSAVHTIAQLCN